MTFRIYILYIRNGYEYKQSFKPLVSLVLPLPWTKACQNSNTEMNRVRNVQKHDVENKLMDTKEGKGMGWSGRLGLTYTTDTMFR